MIPAFPGDGRLAAPPAGLLALWLASWASRRPLIHVARDEAAASRLARAAAGLAPELQVVLLPPWDCLPYDRASPSRAIMGQRMAALLRLGELAERRLVVTTPGGLLQRLPPRTALADAEFRLEAGRELDPEALRRFLLRAGYVLDDRVDEAGEAAVRGSVVDLFPPDAAMPCRIELDGGRIAAIRSFDPLSQRSLAEVDAIRLAPASEALLPAEQVAARLADEATEAPEVDAVVAGSLSEGRRCPGGEHRLPLLYPALESLLDILPDAALVLGPGVTDEITSFTEQVRDAHESRASLRRSQAIAGHDTLILDPGQLYLTKAEFQAACQAREVLALDPAEADTFAVPRFIDGQRPRAAFVEFLKASLAQGDAVLVAVAEERRRRQLSRLIEHALGTAPPLKEGWAACRELPPGEVALLPLDLPCGFRLPGRAVVAAADLLPESEAERASRVDADRLLAADLRPGDHVVHARHGIGILRGLERVEEEGAVTEYLALDYAGERRLLVPALELDQVWRYGSASAGVSLDRLEGDAWQARRREVETELQRTAAALAELAALRLRQQAPELVPPEKPFSRFVRRFPFPLSGDQRRAIEATLRDLARASPPMDRLVCGDVGFGKTEVALRAAAAAALSGRQVAVLAPTTLLVRQHLETFQARFRGLGIEVAQLSRLAKASEAARVREGLADGSIQVVIGTHALAAPGIRFKDLGLVVIDEEQRFGTRHKAGLRALRQGVHVLTMSATPIPRSLQGALAGIQELSIIATAPVRRQPVRTFVLPFEPTVVREALLRERRRGGRSFVVVPRIADIEPMAEILRRIVPELDVVSAHGRMKAERLDEVFLAFADGRHDVLLSTAIIETGLDIPLANTMLIARPERFGMAQLHQLRGRVGRGRERAATYLLHDPEHPLPPATEERLRTLETMEGLGAGFAVSARDLDLRGAGDLLGEAQAGHLQLVGTGLYQHLLEQALSRAQGREPAPDWRPELRLGIALAIPEDYVPEPEVRLDLYARLARLQHPEEADELAEEIPDRFGAPPEPVRELLEVAALRLGCGLHGISKLEAGPKALAATFHTEAAPGERPLPAPLRWSERRLIYPRETSDAADRLAAAAEMLSLLKDGLAQPARA